MENGADLIGTNFGRYRFTKYLGTGAMARVFEAYQSSLGRCVAIKLLHPHFASDSEFVKQFRREARNLATLRHPNIVQVYDFDIQDGMPYMVMELIDGPSLKSIVDESRRKHVRIPLSQSIRIVQNIGTALSYAHKRDVVHRDVKPSNVMLEKTGRVVLTDFGLAKLLSGKIHTISGTIKGTPAYMSPEQGAGNSAEVRSDLYSLGVILFEITTGQLPFSAENPLALVMKHINEPLPAPRAIVPEIPAEIEAIILKMMAKAPGERYQSADAMLEDLAHFSHRVKTAKLPTAKLSELAESSERSSAAPSQPPTGLDAQVSLHFVDTGQILALERGREYTIGRKYDRQPIIPDIDLTPFKAYEWGISRLHAKLDVRDSSVSIVDLGSSNGTWIDGERLALNIPRQLQHGEVVCLGRLRVQVLVYG